MSEPQTYKLTSPHMEGDDIANWQREIVHEFRRMNITYPLVADGDYGVATRSANASLCHSLGMIASNVMAKGITPELRTRIRNRRLTPYERVRLARRVNYRRRLRKRYAGPAGGGVAPPLAKIIADSWGWAPGHDGIDLICPENSPAFAMIRSEVVRVSASGWWGKGAPSDPNLRAKGDGVIVLECLEDIGPFRKGLRVVYGHAERATVRVGDVVKAGEQVGHAGLANAWHLHMCVNGRSDTLGVGDRDPRPYYEYAARNA